MYNIQIFLIFFLEKRNFIDSPCVKHRCHQFYLFFFKLITFKLVHSYNVKHLTYTISYRSGLQNIYKLHTWKCSTFTIYIASFVYKQQKGYYIYKIDQKFFKSAPNDVLTLETDANCLVLLPLLPYLHGRKPVLSFTLSGNKFVDNH